jgi:hypothetical protein
MGISRFNDEDFAALLQDAVQRVQSDEDPIEITRLKRFFKKNVPFSRRNYVGCYLAKIMLEQGVRLPGQKNKSGAERFSPPHKRPQKGEGAFHAKQPHRHAIIDESLAATIFVSIGKNRRVFPRDLVTLLMQVAGLEQDRIGEIRVLDNYSFVQLFSQDADKVIAALNGHEYRGRTLSVSYSRKKEEAASVESDGQTAESAIASGE